MSKLEMMSCDGCGATVEGRRAVSAALEPPLDWLEIVGPVTTDQVVEYRIKYRDSHRHVCSPACLVVLAMRLAADPDAILPRSELSS